MVVEICKKSSKITQLLTLRYFIYYYYYYYYFSIITETLSQLTSFAS